MAKEVGFPTGNEKLDNFMVRVVWARDEDIGIYDKSSSAFLWVIYAVGLMWIWLPDFFDNSHTTIGKRVYIKRSSIHQGYWNSIYRVMRHEFIHILQRKKYWIFYDISYLFPQVLAVFSLLSLLAIWLSNWWLLCLSFLLFLAPLPAHWRKKFEMEGYTQTMLVSYEMTGDVPETLVHRIARNFTGPLYYFMWPFKGRVMRELESIAGKIMEGKIRGPYLHYSR